MTYNMDNESKRQELASRLVEREVYYCVSSLVSTLSTLAQHCGREADISWEDDILPLLESYDYEQAGIDAINNCSDLAELETMADAVGYWSDAVEKTDWDECTLYDEGDGEEPHEMSFDDWFQMFKETDSEGPILEVLRGYIEEQATDWEEFCRENDVEVRDSNEYRAEVYEHWIVSDWLAARLKEKGCITGELCGLTIYGRCCTGQSMSLDRNMQEIACELWDDEAPK